MSIYRFIRRQLYRIGLSKTPVRKYLSIKDLRSFHDVRDLPYYMSAENIVLPAKVAITKAKPPIFDQGNEGSCTANGWVRLAIIQLTAKLGAMVILSRQMMYYLERAREGTIRKDAGAQVRTGGMVLVKDGVCREDLWPYSKKFTLKPSKAAYADAPNHMLGKFYRCADIAAIRQALYDNNPVVIGIAVYDSFESNAVARSGMVPVPDTAREHLLGGHLMMVEEHDATAGLFKVANSWSEQWGDKGYCYIPDAYIGNPHLAFDFFTATV